METSDLLTLLSLSIALLALVYTYISNTKRYELRYQYRCEVLKWYSDTITTLAALKEECKEGFLDLALKRKLLAELSSKIEIGRFYFPNIDKGDGFGKEKPKAYQGYRNLMLDFLVYSYRFYERERPWEQLKHAEVLQNHFTSFLIEIIDPKKFLKETEKLTSTTLTRELNFEHFISENPELIKNYI